MKRLAIGFVVFVLCGCGAQPRGSDGANAAERGPVPAYGEVARRYNERCRGLERIKDGVTLVVTSKGEDGKERRDQLEANLQIIRPSKLSLRIDKTGQTLCLLGCDETRYWWIDLSDEPSAMVGTHAKATAETARKFGVPVHPLELIEALAITPLPETGGAVAWGAKDVVVVTLKSAHRGWGSRRVHVNTGTWEPVKVELLDTAGRVSATAALSRFVQVEVTEDRFAPARMASRYRVDLPLHDVSVVVSVPNPVNPGADMKTKPFELAALLKGYGVDEARVRDLDAGPP